MKRLKTIKYISETSVEDMINDIKTKNMDLNQVVAAALDARKEFGLRVGEFINEVAKLQKEIRVGMILETKENCMNNFRKGQRVEVTQIAKEGYVIDSVVVLDEVAIRTFFKIAEVIC